MALLAFKMKDKKRQKKRKKGRKGSNVHSKFVGCIRECSHVCGCCQCGGYMLDVSLTVVPVVVSDVIP
jgi:hypothetical protein